MTQPESRTVERLAEVLRDVHPLRVEPDTRLDAVAAAILLAAKEHGLVIGEGLEVERLNRAMKAAYPSEPVDFMDDARAIAYEYARLSGQPSQESAE
jgi:hypothetical protein